MNNRRQYVSTRGRSRILTAAVLCVALASAPLGYAQTLPRARPEAVGLSSERLKRLSEALNGYVKDGRLPGGVVLVARRGKVAYAEAFGQRDREAGAPMREDAVFRIASQTKALVSVGVMILQEEGRLLISDPVGKYLPEFRETTVAVPKQGGGYEVVKAKRPVTIRDLLTHTAGVGYGGGVARDRWEAAKITGWYFADRDEPVGATVARMAALPFDAQPGERWVYGYSTDILGALVEKASGQPLDDFLRARIFDPLGMKDTHFYLPESKAERLRRGLLGEGGGRVGARAGAGRDGRAGRLREGAAEEFLGRRGAALDGERLRAFPLDASERGRAGREASAQPQERGVDDGRSHQRRAVPRGAGVRARLHGGEGFGLARSAGLGRRVRLGRRVPFDLLG